MMTVFQVPVEVYQAYATYAKETGEEVCINDLIIGSDARAYIHVIGYEGNGPKFTPLYITHDIQDTIMDRCNVDSEKVQKFMKEYTDKMKGEVHNV